MKKKAKENWIKDDKKNEKKIKTRKQEQREQNKKNKKTQENTRKTRNTRTRKTRKTRTTRGGTAYLIQNIETIVRKRNGFAQGCHRFSALDFSRTGRLPMPNRALSEIPGRELSENRLLNFGTLSVVEKTSVENRSHLCEAPTRFTVTPPPYLYHGVQGL